MTTEENAGAAKYRAKRRKQWAIHGLWLFVVAVIGYVIGGYVGYAEGMQEPAQNFISARLAWALVLLFLFVFWGDWFLRTNLPMKWKSIKAIWLFLSHLSFTWVSSWRQKRFIFWVRPLFWARPLLCMRGYCLARRTQ